jgi:hypothetical protein
LREGNNLDSNHNIIKVYSFNSDMGNWHLPLHELDFSHFYLHWNLSSAGNGFLCEIVTDNGSNNQPKNLVKQRYLESMKGSGAMSNKKMFNIKFTNDGNIVFMFGFRDFYWIMRCCLD